ncbi:MAG: hypothetical protein DI547_00805 [Sphingobium sp.]|nr:MAG: hypothetical protein DI547_00805 [Sphingobium sp.]
MRQDARSLLERLGRKGFRYEEFSDPFADMELWPIFEALLRDERVVGTQPSTIRMAEVEMRAATRPDVAAPAQMAGPLAAPAHLFDRYAAPAADPTPPNIVNMRQFFGRLSDGER